VKLCQGRFPPTPTPTQGQRQKQPPRQAHSRPSPTARSAGGQHPTARATARRPRLAQCLRLCLTAGTVPAGQAAFYAYHRLCHATNGSARRAERAAAQRPRSGRPSERSERGSPLHGEGIRARSQGRWVCPGGCSASICGLMVVLRPKTPQNTPQACFPQYLWSAAFAMAMTSRRGNRTGWKTSPSR